MPSHFGAFSRAFLRRCRCIMHAAPRRYYGASILEAHPKRRYIANYQTKFHREARGDYFHEIIDARSPFYHVSSSRSLVASSPLPTAVQFSARRSTGIVEEALLLPGREKFLESRREIKSPAATRVDDSVSLMRE